MHPSSFDAIFALNCSELFLLFYISWKNTWIKMRCIRFNLCVHEVYAGKKSIWWSNKGGWSFKKKEDKWPHAHSISQGNKWSKRLNNCHSCFFGYKLSDKPYVMWNLWLEMGISCECFKRFIIVHETSHRRISCYTIRSKKVVARLAHVHRVESSHSMLLCWYIALSLCCLSAVKSTPINTDYHSTTNFCFSIPKACNSSIITDN